jgi:dipeptidase E
MKLLFYSGGQTNKNHVLHQSLSELAGSGKRKSFAYIPFCADGSEVFYRRAIKRYQRFGFSRFQCLNVDQKFTKDELKKILDSDVIYLAGGNTFYFLKHLRESGVLPKLKRYALEGGVLAGLSAGGLVMTPSIALAGYPLDFADENDVGLKDLRSLNLVDFEFFPHFEDRPRLRKQLQTYSTHSKHPVLAVADGGGIIVNGHATTLLGTVALWSHGQYHRLS